MVTSEAIDIPLLLFLMWKPIIIPSITVQLPPQYLFEDNIQKKKENKFETLKAAVKQYEEVYMQIIINILQLFPGVMAFFTT